MKILNSAARAVGLLLVCAVAQAQNLPSEWYFSPDGRTLYTGGRPDQGLYHPDSIRTVNLTFPQSNYWTLLGQNYASETNLIASMTMAGQTLDSIGVRFRGNTSYTTIGSSQKKSFGIETDWLRLSHGDRLYLRSWIKR